MTTFLSAPGRLVLGKVKTLIVFFVWIYGAKVIPLSRTITRYSILSSTLTSWCPRIKHASFAFGLIPKIVAFVFSVSSFIFIHVLTGFGFHIP
ncbi:hypothetical protein Zmor_015564 [Zophobas morio]|uniref:Uncharacterized protein n=1 Tax=Zophobas morio TaxID=2755281 RepID=A0AA38IJP9_9CUCU|nr:hypothetical protein Zmor_015564 [Zophobas morio]